jgi:flagellar biosynthesis protein FliQ
VNELTVLELGRNAMLTTVLLSAPMLGAALVVGLLVSVFQALTQINEVTLTFVPKILAIFAVVAVAGPWLINTLLSYTVGVFTLLPSMVR